MLRFCVECFHVDKWVPANWDPADGEPVFIWLADAREYQRAFEDEYHMTTRVVEVIE